MFIVLRIKIIKNIISIQIYNLKAKRIKVLAIIRFYNMWTLMLEAHLTVWPFLKGIIAFLLSLMNNP